MLSKLPTKTLLAASVAALIHTNAYAQQAQELDTIKVTSAAGFEQDLTQASASVTVITAEDLQQQRYNNLAQALQNVEGIDVRGSTGKTGGMNISIRGMPSEYTLVLIDGRRQNTSGEIAPNGFGEFSTSFIPPLSAIERIEVIRGPASTLYGSDAMGGVINIITKPVSEEWGGALTFDNTFQENKQYGGTSNFNAIVSGPLIENLLGLQVRGSFFEREESNLKPTGDDGTQTFNTRGQTPVKSRIHNLGARLNLTPDQNHNVYLDFETSRQWYDNGRYNERKLAANDSATNWRGYADSLEFSRDALTLGHRSELGFGRWESSLLHSVTESDGRTIGFSGAYNLDTVTGKPVPGQPSGIRDLNIGEHRELKNTNLIVDTKLVLPLGSHRLTVGGQYHDAELKDGVAPQTMSQYTLAVFVEDEWYLTDKLALTLGGRYDEHETYGGNFSPRAYLVFNATNQLTLKGGVAQAYKAPRVNQIQEGLVGLTAQGASGSIGSPHLQPETSTSYELAAMWQGANGVDLAATVFFNDIEDKIATGIPLTNCEFDYQAYVANYTGNSSNMLQEDDFAPVDPNNCYSSGPGSFPSQYEYGQSVNADKATTQGIELSARLPLDVFIPGAMNWSLSANYTYTDSELKNRSEGKKDTKLADTPEHMFNARLNWAATDTINTWLALEYRGESRRFDDHPDDLDNGTTAGRNNKRLYDTVGDLKAYEVFNLGASWQVAENVTLSAMVYNLLDKDFRKWKSYEEVNGDTAWASVYSHQTQSTKGSIQEGRRYWLSANYNF